MIENLHSHTCFPTALLSSVIIVESHGWSVWVVDPREEKPQLLLAPER
jgi:hypothetical protein